METIRKMDGCVLTCRASGDGSMLVRACGELDMVNAADLKEVLLAAVRSAQEVTLDLGRVQFIDSSGLTAILLAAEAARTAGHCFSLSQISSRTRRLIEVAGVTGILTIDPDVQSHAPAHGMASTPSG